MYRGKWSEDKQSKYLIMHTLDIEVRTYIHTTISDGYGELQFASNDVYRGHWKDGVRHGSVSIFTVTIDITVLRRYVTAANTDSIRRFLKTVIASIASIATHSNP